MKTNFLFPHRVKVVGWILFIPSFLLGLFNLILNNWPTINCKVFAFIADISAGNNSPGSILGTTGFFTFTQENIYAELIAIPLILGGLFVAFSKVKDEDEYIARIRWESLVWATYVNYGLLLLAFIFVYGTPFLTIMLIDMFTVLIFFIIRFHYFLFKSRKSLKHEEHA